MLTSDLFFLIFLEVLERLTSDRRLRALLSYIWGTFGLPPTESPWGMTALLQKHYFDGAYNKQKHVLQSLPKCRTSTFAICPKKMIHKRRILSRGRLLQSLPKCRTPTFAICRKLNQKKAHTIPWADLHKSPLGSCRRSPEVFFLSHSTHFSHMSEPILPISHLLNSVFVAGGAVLVRAPVTSLLIEGGAGRKQPQETEILCINTFSHTRLFWMKCLAHLSSVTLEHLSFIFFLFLCRIDE